ncbi:DUF2272 domain-containing protein [Oleomonas cavernae]|nr:DUF2272 domain-containing protein [Oleomonas cavernae]
MVVTEFDQRAAAIAMAEWWFFGSPYVDGESSTLQIHTAPGSHGVPGDESKDGWRHRTWTYMKVGVYPDSDGWESQKAEPWSAAFISFVMRTAGAKSRFPYSMSHSTYVSKAVLNRLSGNTQDTIVAYRSDEIVPLVGDLMWRGRKSEDPAQVDTSGWGLDDIAAYIKAGGDSFPSHCDLVVRTDLQAKQIYLIGGNVRDRVLRTRVTTDANGLAKGAAHTVVLRNNIAE